MVKRLAIILLVFLVFGCGDLRKEKKSKPEEAKEKAREEQLSRNMLGEDISLLATKYEISETQLTEILVDYETMTQLVSMTGFWLDKQPSTEETVDIPTALTRISEKYGISKKIISTLIIERKMMERCQNRVSQGPAKIEGVADERHQGAPEY